MGAGPSGTSGRGEAKGRKPAWTEAEEYVDLDEQKESCLIDHRKNLPEVSDAVMRARLITQGEFAKPKESNLAAFASVLWINMKLQLSGKKDSFFTVVYARWSTESTWVCLLITDPQMLKEDEVDFHHPVKVQFSLEKHRLLRFEVYAVRTENTDDLRNQKLIGSANTSLIDTILARRVNLGWHVLDIVHPKKVGVQAKFGAYAEEDTMAKQLISFDLSADFILKTDKWKLAADPYVKVLVPTVGVTQKRFTTVFRTAVHRRMRKGSWGRLEIKATQLWPQGECDTLLQFWDWFRVSEHRLIGETWVRYGDLMNAFHGGSKMTLAVFKPPRPGEHVPQCDCRQHYKNGWVNNDDTDKATLKKVAIVHLREVNMERMYSVLDYLRGGLSLKLCFAVDLTRSGGQEDLHKMDLQSHTNSYIGIMKALGDVMKVYDDDNRYPAYGLGARLPPTYSVATDHFALSGDFLHPEIEGIDGIIDAYKRALRIARLHGPTRLSPIVDLAIKMALDHNKLEDKNVEMAFHVMLILTDGGIDENDKPPFIEKLVEAADVPLQVVIICCGNGDFSFFHDLNNTVAEARRIEGVPEETIILRDITHCVELRPSGFTDAEVVRAAAAKAMERIPQEVMGFYKGRDCKPRNLDKFEDSSGKPNQRPDKFQAREKRRSTRIPSRSSRGGRSSTHESEESLDSSAHHVDMAKFAAPEVAEHLKHRKEEMYNTAKSLGYTRRHIDRAFRDGVPADNLDILVDSIINCGYGKSPCYRDLLHKGNADDNISIALNVSRTTALRLLDGIRDQLQCDRVSLFVLDFDANVLRLFAAHMENVITIAPGHGLAGHVLSNKELLNIPDCYKDHRFEQSVDQTTGYTTRSMMAVPLVDDVNETALGVLQVINKLPNTEAPAPEVHKNAIPFPSTDEELAMMYAHGIGGALIDGELYEDDVSSLLSRGMEIVEKAMAANVKRIDEKAVRELCMKLLLVMRCDRFVCYTKDETTSELFIQGTYFKGIQRYKSTHGIAVACIRDHEIMNVEDAYEDKRFSQHSDKHHQYKTKSILATPIFDSAGHAIGALEAVNKLPMNVAPNDPAAHKSATVFPRRDEPLLVQAAGIFGKCLEAGSFEMEDVSHIMRSIAENHRARASVILSAGSLSEFGGAAAELADRSPSLRSTAALPNAPTSMDDVSPPVNGALATMLVDPVKGKSRPTSREANDVWNYCRICMEQPVAMEQIPCGHKLLCADCAKHAPGPCLSCNTPITGFKPQTPAAGRRSSAPVERTATPKAASRRSSMPTEALKARRSSTPTTS